MKAVNCSPELLFIGGWGTTRDIWQGVLAHLPTHSPTWRFHFLDWQDCLQQWPTTIKRALATAAQPPIVVGWSLGAMLALRAAHEFPGKIAGLVLLSAMPRLTNDGCEAGVTPRILQAMRLRLARNPASVLWDFAGQCLAPDGDQTIRRLFLRLAANFSAGELDAGLELLSTLDLCAQVDKIAIPCRLLHGSDDRIVPLASAQMLQALLPAARLLILSGRGHAIPYTAPSEIAQAIEAMHESIFTSVERTNA